jgi:hypothetical protein
MIESNRSSVLEEDECLSGEDMDIINKKMD